MARNKMNDLRDHLFAQLEILGDEEIKGDDLQQAIDKASAVANIGNVIINSAKIEVDFMKATGMISTSSELFKGVIDIKKLD